MSSRFLSSPKIKKNFVLRFLGRQFNNLQRAALLASFCRFNNLQWAAHLTLSIQYDKILSKFGEQQLVMVNYVRDFN